MGNAGRGARCNVEQGHRERPMETSIKVVGGWGAGEKPAMCIVE